MKYLTKSTDIAHLYTLKGLLEANGIPAVVKGENTAAMISPFPMTEPTLWIYVDEQEEEAEKLILDPDYEVQHGIDVEEFYRMTSEVADNPKQLVDTMLNWGMVIAVVSALIIILAILAKG